MSNRGRLEQIAAGSCASIMCPMCPVLKQCEDDGENGPPDDLPESLRAEARRQLAELDESSTPAPGMPEMEAMNKAVQNLTAAWEKFKAGRA